MNENKTSNLSNPKIIVKYPLISQEEEQKRMDEVLEILYELYCQYQVSKSVLKSNIENINPFLKEDVS